MGHFLRKIPSSSWSKCRGVSFHGQMRPVFLTSTYNWSIHKRICRKLCHSTVLHAQTASNVVSARFPTFGGIPSFPIQCTPILLFCVRHRASLASFLSSSLPCSFCSACHSVCLTILSSSRPHTHLFTT